MLLQHLLPTKVRSFHGNFSIQSLGYWV
jgi:hypothetical protein